jgi:hypothetical protein
MVPALLIDVIAIFPCSPLLNWAFLPSSIPIHPSRNSPIRYSMQFQNTRGSPRAFENTTTLMS